MTTPKMSGSSPANTNKQSPGSMSDCEGDLLDGMMPKDLAAGAHDALMEEIHMLQVENGKLKVGYMLDLGSYFSNYWRRLG